jgi:hypothetical protein
MWVKMPDEAAGVGAATARIRETAKWLTVSLATLGGILVAGTQLSAIGKLNVGTARFWAALVGGGVAAALAGLILWLSILIATSRAISMSDVLRDKDKRPGGIDWLYADSHFLDGYQDARALDEAYLSALNARDEGYREFGQAVEAERKAFLDVIGRKDALDRAVAEVRPEARRAYEMAVCTHTLATRRIERLAGDLERANGDVLSLNETVNNYLSVAVYSNLSYRWRRIGAGILGCGVFAAIGIGVFTWAANPPDTVTASMLTPGVLAAPHPVIVTLTATGRTALSSALGGECRTDGGLAGLQLGQTDAGPDVLIQNPHCTATRFIAVPAWASVKQS